MDVGLYSYSQREWFSGQGSRKCKHPNRRRAHGVATRFMLEPESGVAGDWLNNPDFCRSLRRWFPGAFRSPEPVRPLGHTHHLRTPYQSHPTPIFDASLFCLAVFKPLLVIVVICFLLVLAYRNTQSNKRSVVHVLLQHVDVFVDPLQIFDLVPFRAVNPVQGCCSRRLASISSMEHDGPACEGAQFTLCLKEVPHLLNRHVKRKMTVGG